MVVFDILIAFLFFCIGYYCFLKKYVVFEGGVLIFLGGSVASSLIARFVLSLLE